MSKLSFVADIFFVAIIIALSLFLSGFLLQGEILDTKYQDWLVHAYRIRILEDYGYTSWIHNWSNGISPWQSYQFLPHVFTILIKSIFSLSITKSMILASVALFIFARLSLYIVLRLLSFSPMASLVATVMSFSIATFWAASKDYSLLFGYSFFPILFYIWVLYYKKKLTYFFPLLTGLTFFIHPMLAMSLVTLWLIGSIFSSKSIISKSFTMELIILAISSSVFWVPILFTHSYTFTNSFFSTQDFIIQVLKDYNFFGLNIIILSIAFISFLIGSSDKKNSWFISLSFFTLLLTMLTIIGSLVELPKFLYITQFSRSTGIINLSMIIIGTFLLEKIFKGKLFILKLLIISLTTIAFVQGIEYSTRNAPFPTKQINDPINILYSQNLDFNNGRVWTPLIGSSSYYANSDVYFPFSYNEHLDSNPLGQRLGQYLIFTNQNKALTKSTANTINNFLKITGTKYVFLPTNNSLTDSFQRESNENIKNTTLISNNDNSYILHEMKWGYNSAVFITETIANNSEFLLSKKELSNPLILDDLVNNLAANIDFEEENILKTSYPAHDQISIDIKSDKKTNYIFVNESYDPNWSAFLDGEKLSIRKFGPNFMIIDLSNHNGNSLVLKHNWPIHHYMSLYLIIFLFFAIPVYRIGYLATKGYKTKEKKLKLYEIN